jgi:two-component system, NarL family, nitrate/nitrite response regulator NarL
MPSIVCVVVHPSRIVRAGLASIFAESPFQPACTASSIEDVPSTVASAGQQLLVIIGVREGSDLVDDLAAVKASFPDAHVVVLDDPGKRDLVMTALASGATSFVDENVATSTLMKQLELLTQGEPVISVSVLKSLLEHSSILPFEKAMMAPAVDQPEASDAQGEPQEMSQLSDREAAILNGLVQGASNKVIANQLKITEATVKVHVKAILRKIRVKNRTQAAIWAMHRQSLPMHYTQATANWALPDQVKLLTVASANVKSGATTAERAR